MDYLIVGSLIAEVLILSRVDRRVFGTWFTPFTLLSVPYGAVAVLAFLFAPSLDFAPLYTPSLCIWIVGLFIFWVVGFVLGWGIFGLDCQQIDKPSILHPAVPKSNTEARSIKWANWAAWAMAPILLLGFLSTLRTSGGWEEIGGPEYRDNYSRGLHAHLIVVGLAVIILLIGCNGKGKKLQLLSIAILMVFVFASQVKGTFFQPIIGGLAYRSLRGAAGGLTIKRILTVVSCSFLVFLLIYMTGFLIVDPLVAKDWDLYSVLSRHYLFYLFAGPLSLGEAVRTHVTNVGGEWYTLFSPFINISRVVMGSTALVPTGSALEKGMDVDYQRPLMLGGANVYTFFGTPYLYLGLFGSMLYVVAVSLFCYGLLIHAKRSGNEWVLVAYCFIGAQLFFGFFELYFSYLTSLELIAYSFVLSFVTKWQETKTRHVSKDLDFHVEARSSGA
jgi:oligosaccharide repeat unit polymerase